MIWRIVICILVGYAFGCISTGYLVGKSRNIDIRKYGSGNIGTTNALRTLGKKAALITLLGDVLKCMIPVLLIKFLIFRDVSYAELLGLYTALGVVVGHVFPFYLKFKGGKGIAVIAGTILTFDLRISLICLITFIVVLYLTRYVSVGSLTIVTEFLIWVAITRAGEVHLLCLTIVFTALAYYTHRANIKRLREGNENKIGKKVAIPVEDTKTDKEN